jgi:DNA topoisomerase I
LRDRHADIRGSHISLRFRGKSGVRQESDINNPRLARIVRSCRDLPGYELFQYLDDAGERHAVSSTEVNLYLREITGEDITAKDFRTWAGTNLAALALREFADVEGEAVRKRAVVRTVERVARHLGNTPAICRRCYIHPAIFDGFLDGTLLGILEEKTRAYRVENAEGLSAEEAAVVAFLRSRLGELAEKAA